MKEAREMNRYISEDTQSGLHIAARSTMYVIVMFSLIVCANVAIADTQLPRHPNRAEVSKLDESGCDAGFSFAVVGDIHQNNETFEEMIRLSRASGVDFAVAVGDFTNDGKPEEYENYVEHINASELPWFTVPGNHEYRSPDGHTSLAGKKRYKRIFGKADFVFTHCGWAFAGLDTPAFDALLPTQLNKLEKVLKRYKGRSVVFSHYPPAIIPNWEDGIWVSNAASFMNLLDRYETPFSFSGHIHVYDEYKKGPVTYVITGGGGGTLDSDRGPANLNSPDSGAFYHFIIATVRQGRLDFRIVKLAQETHEPVEH